MKLIFEEKAITILAESTFEEAYLKTFSQAELFEDGWGIQIEQE